jgi:biopolymer transport protein ExbD
LLGPISIETTDELEQRLRAVKEARPEVQVLLRADRNVTYYGVRAAMQAVAKAGIEIMNIAAEVED